MQTEFDFISSKGDKVCFRPAVGADQIEALRRKGASMAEQNSILLSRCIKTVNGDLVVNPMDYARKLPLRDRHALLGCADRAPALGRHDRDRGLRGLQRGADDRPWLG